MYHILAKKHKMSFHKLFSNYGQEFGRKEDFHGIFPLKSSIASLKKTFRVKDLLSKPLDAFNQLHLKKNSIIFTKCSVENRSNSNIEIYDVRALKTRIETNNF